MTQVQAIIEDWKPLHRYSLLGFARVRMPSGVIFHDVSVHRSNASFWASPAAKPQIGRNGTQLRARDGKGLFVPVVSFATKELRDRFSAAVITALQAAHPEALSVQATADADAG
jgi:hypothetical protein